MISQLVKNTNFAAISNVIRIGANIFLFAIIARALGVEDFGKFTFAVTFTTIFLYIANFGLDRVTVLDISRDNLLIGQYFGNVMVAKVVISVITVIVICLIINLLGYPYKTKLLVYILTIAMIFTSYSNVLCSMFRGFEKLEYESVVTLFTNLALLGMTFIVIISGYGVVAVAIVYLISRLAAFIYSLIIYNFKIKAITLSFNYNFSKNLVKKAFPFALLTMLTAILFDIDTILISYLCNDQIVAFYQSPMKIITALTVIPHILDSSFYPVLSKSYGQNNNLNRLGSKLITILIYMGIPLMTGIIMLADKIILLIYGEGFRDAIIVFKILSIVLFLRFIIKGYETVLLSTGKQNIVTYMVFTAVIFNIALNIKLIPTYGMIGAAFSAIITHAFILISYICILKRSQNIIMIENSAAFILAASFLSGYLIYIFKNNNLFILILLFSLSYFVFTFYLLEKERSWLIKKLGTHINLSNKFYRP